MIRTGRMLDLPSEVELGRELLALAQEWPEQPEGRDTAAGKISRPRTARKPKLATLIKRARALGVHVALAPDGTVTFRTGAPASTDDSDKNELDKWLEKHNAH